MRSRPCSCYTIESHAGEIDLEFLKEAFTRLMLNFQWWVNRKDPSGRNVFEGGFLGLDNIGVFDRSAKLPTGGSLEQADGTAWMAMFSQNMLELAIAVAEHDPAYEDLVLKFVEHFFWIAAAVDPMGDHPDELWDEEDGFFYDVLRRPDGTGQRLKVRSLVGILPMCAVTVIEPELIERYPRLAARIREYLDRNRDLLTTVADPLVPGANGRRILALVNEDKLRRILTRVLDEERFLGPHGIRSLSRWHLDHPYRLDVEGTVYEVQYEPAESTTGMFGGNSNWRGPGVGADQRPDRPSPPAALPVLRRRVQDRVPDGLGRADDALRGRDGAVATDRLDLPARTRRQAPRLRRHAPLPGGPALAGPDPVLRVLPRGQRRRARRCRTRPGGRAWSPV